MLDDPNDLGIIDGVIGLAESFQLEVIAEGVESTQHGLMLLNLGCEHAQGYGIAKPMSADKIAPWIKNYSSPKEWTSFDISSLSIKQSRKSIFIAVLTRWYNRIELYLHSSGSGLVSMPILVSQQTACGVWIKREQRSHLFETEWLNKLKRFNKEMCEIGNLIFACHEEGDKDKAEVHLSSLKQKVDLAIQFID
jgi:hypothetical protein